MPKKVKKISGTLKIIQNNKNRILLSSQNWKVQVRKIHLKIIALGKFLGLEL